MNVQPLAIITADWHIITHAWKSRPTLSGDAECSLRQVADLARRTGLPIIAAGDLFDSKRPDSSSLLLTHELLRDTEGCYIQGNHDKQPLPWMKLVAPAWTHLDKSPITLSGIMPPDDTTDLGPLFSKAKIEVPPLFNHGVSRWNIHGIDYVGTKEQLQERLEQINIKKGSNIADLLVLHQSSSATMPMDINELFDGMIPDEVDLVVLGHEHTAKVCEVLSCSGRKIPMISPGGFHILSILEDAKKLIYILYTDGSVKSLPLITRRVLSMNLHDKTDSEIREDIAALQQKIKKGRPRPPEIKKPIVYARMNEATAPDADRILKAELGDSVHLFLKRERSDADEVEMNMNHLENIDITRHSESGFEYVRSIFHKFESDANVRNMVERLLETEPSEETYQALKSQFLETQTC